MFKKGSKLYSILTGTCPRCHGEKMYVYKSPFRIFDLLKLKDHCSKCGLRYHIEPAFFFGAMYVSYGLNVLLGILIFLISFYGLHAGLFTTFWAILLILMILLPPVLRLSRNIYINMFVNYESEAGK